MCVLAFLDGALYFWWFSRTTKGSPWRHFGESNLKVHPLLYDQQLSFMIRIAQVLAVLTAPSAAASPYHQSFLGGA